MSGGVRDIIGCYTFHYPIYSLLNESMKLFQRILLEAKLYNITPIPSNYGWPHSVNWHKLLVSICITIQLKK